MLIYLKYIRLKNVVFYIRFLMKNTYFDVFFYISIIQFSKFFCKVLILFFFLKKYCFTKINFFKKCRFLHKVFNRKCKFLLFVFLFYLFSVFEDLLYNFSLFFEKKIVLLKTNFFQKFRFLHKVINRNCKLWCFYFSIFPFFSFWILFSKSFSLIFWKRRVFYLKEFLFEKLFH